MAQVENVKTKANWRHKISEYFKIINLKITYAVAKLSGCAILVVMPIS